MDIRILRELTDVPPASPAQTDIRKSMRKVAKNLRLSESAVRERVSKLRKSGFLKGWTPLLNPSLLGLRVSMIWVDVDGASKQSTAKKLQLMPGTVGFLNFLGTLTGMMVFYESPEAFGRELELIQRVAEPHKLVHSELRFPPPRVKPLRTDYRLLLSLLDGAQKSYKEIAEELGLSSRTVRRRLETLTSSWALFAVPSFDPRKLEGANIACLVLTYDSPESKMKMDAAVRSRFGGSLVSSQMGMVDRGVFMFCFSNISKSSELLAWAKEQPGVGDCRVDILEEITQRFDWLTELLHRKLDEMPNSERKEGIPQSGAAHRVH